MSWVECNHRPCTTQMVGRCWDLDVIIALGQHTRSYDIRRGMPTWSLARPSVACSHRPCTAHIVRRHRAWQMARTKQYWTMWSITCNHRTSEAYMVRRRLAWHAISRLDNTHGRTTSSVGCHHRPWRAHTIALRRAWHAIIALEQHTRLDDVGREIPSSSIESIPDRTTLGMACYNRPWIATSVCNKYYKDTCLFLNTVSFFIAIYIIWSKWGCVL